MNEIEILIEQKKQKNLIQKQIDEKTKIASIHKRDLEQLIEKATSDDSLIPECVLMKQQLDSFENEISDLLILLNQEI